ncbi:hypothetical protein HK405_014925, partial [Cladochytrium tenue]
IKCDGVRPTCGLCLRRAGAAASASCRYLGTKRVVSADAARINGDAIALRVRDDVLQEERKLAAQAAVGPPAHQAFAPPSAPAPPPSSGIPFADQMLQTLLINMTLESDIYSLLETPDSAATLATSDPSRQTVSSFLGVPAVAATGTGSDPVPAVAAVAASSTTFRRPGAADSEEMALVSRAAMCAAGAFLPAYSKGWYITRDQAMWYYDRARELALEAFESQSIELLQANLLLAYSSSSIPQLTGRVPLLTSSPDTVGPVCSDWIWDSPAPAASLVGAYGGGGRPGDNLATAYVQLMDIVHDAAALSRRMAKSAGFAELQRQEEAVLAAVERWTASLPAAFAAPRDVAEAAAAAAADPHTLVRKAYLHVIVHGVRCQMLLRRNAMYLRSLARRGGGSLGATHVTSGAAAEHLAALRAAHKQASASARAAFRLADVLTEAGADVAWLAQQKIMYMSQAALAGLLAVEAAEAEGAELESDDDWLRGGLERYGEFLDRLGEFSWEARFSHELLRMVRSRDWDALGEIEREPGGMVRVAAVYRARRLGLLPPHLKPSAVQDAATAAAVGTAGGGASGGEPGRERERTLRELAMLMGAPTTCAVTQGTAGNAPAGTTPLQMFQRRVQEGSGLLVLTLQALRAVHGVTLEAAPARAVAEKLQQQQQQQQQQQMQQQQGGDSPASSAPGLVSAAASESSAVEAGSGGEEEEDEEQDAEGDEEEGDSEYERDGGEDGVLARKGGGEFGGAAATPGAALTTAEQQWRLLDAFFDPLGGKAAVG